MAQSLIQSWLETHVLDTWLGERQPWGWIRLSDWVKETHCVVETEWKFISVWFYDFLFYFLFFILLFLILLVR